MEEKLEFFLQKMKNGNAGKNGEIAKKEAEGKRECCPFALSASFADSFFC